MLACRSALLSLWCFQYEREAEGDETDPDLLSARFMSHWVGDQAPSGWFGMLKGRCTELGLAVLSALPACTPPKHASHATNLTSTASTRTPGVSEPT